MKAKIPLLILASMLCTTISSQGVVVMIGLRQSTVDDGALDSSAETWTTSVTGFNGTDASFDLVISAAALNGTAWFPNFFNGQDDLAIAGDGSRDDRIDGTNEDATFSLSIANFNAGTSGYVVGNVDFGFLGLTLIGSRQADDSGTFSLLNGVAPFPSLTWTETDNGNDFTGDNGDDSFNLQLMNDTYGSGSRLTSFQHDIASGDWRYSRIDIEYEFQQVVPEPSIASLLGLGFGSILLRRRRS